MHALRSAVTEADEGSARQLHAFLMQGIGVIEEKPVRVSVIVRGKERIHGTTMLFRSGNQPYHEADLRLLESIATLTGIAMDRALFFEDTIAKSEEIRARNRELDDFTYVVSHDLKEPLITIEGYSTIIEKDFGNVLPPEALTYLKASVQAVNRMKRLIDDLLALSRLGRAHDREAVSMRTVVDSVLSDLDFRLKERQAKVFVPENLPIVRYNPTQLGLLFRNLFSNGIKFNRSERPEIHIEVKEGSNEFTVSVQDNGIGIPEEYFDRIFVIFQRLHPAGEYAGTGVGLTIVKKIIERHRGRIWVESTPGTGTKISFTIPL